MKRLIKNVIAGQNPLTSTCNTTVRAAAQKMAKRGVGTVLIVSDDGKLVGILSERDILNKVVAVGQNPDTTPVSAIMVQQIVTTTADRLLGEALHLMRDGKFRHVPVVNENHQPIGIVSIRDAFSEDLADFEREARLMENLSEIIA